MTDTSAARAIAAVLFLWIAEPALAQLPTGCPDGPMQSARLRVTQDSTARQILIRWGARDSVTHYRVTIDDAASLRRPVTNRQVRGTSLRLDAVDAGFAPGVRYYVRVAPGATSAFCLRRTPLADPVFTRDYVKRAWQNVGRADAATYGGMAWDSAARAWKTNPSWPGTGIREGAEAYFLEPSMRAAINLAMVTRDSALTEELVEFYLAYAGRYTTLGQLRQVQGRRRSTELLDDQGPDSARTLGWIEPLRDGERARECQLCNSQFYHPVARLVRLVSMLPARGRTARAREFVARYTPLIVQDHLLRMVFVARWDYWGDTSLPPTLIDIWRRIASDTTPPRYSYQRAIHDWDLWYMATAAEMLGAAANDPQLVRIAPGHAARLHELVREGLRAVARKQTLYANTKDFAGRVVTSVSWFNGDQDDHPEMAYAGWTSDSFPPTDREFHPSGGSWDVSHAYRIPVFLRAMLDNRKATGATFPTPADAVLLVNHYTYRVFTGDFRKPRFRNFLDGSDGWYRVGYGGPGTGFAPSGICDERQSSRRCASAGAFWGWGLVDYLNLDLARVMVALTDVSVSIDPEVTAYRAAYLVYPEMDFTPRTAAGEIQYPPLLFGVLAEIADRLR